jgi:hypothetical protein
VCVYSEYAKVLHDYPEESGLLELIKISRAEHGMREDAVGN